MDKRTIVAITKDRVDTKAVEIEDSVEETEDLEDNNQDNSQEIMIISIVEYVNKMDMITCSGVQSSQHTFQEGTTQRVSHKIYAKNAWELIKSHAIMILLNAIRNMCALPQCTISLSAINAGSTKPRRIG